MSRETQWIFLDSYRRHMCVKHELRRILLKSLIKNTHLSLGHRYSAILKQTAIVRVASINKIRNRCVISGRRSMVVNKVKYSRFVFRNESYSSSLPGVRRASW